MVIISAPTLRQAPGNAKARRDSFPRGPALGTLPPTIKAYVGYMGKMEKIMGTTIWGSGFRDIPPRMENQWEANMANEILTGQQEF